MPPRAVRCSQPWEALSGDPVDWLLDPDRPNLRWRVLVDLIGRPVDSPAVLRAKRGANDVAPVSELLSDLQALVESTALPALWSRYRGPGWRLIAAVQWGADPQDSCLHAASAAVLERAPGEGGLRASRGGGVEPQLTARALQAMVALGWQRHARVQEWLAWLEATPGWELDPTTAVGVLAAVGRELRPILRTRATEGLGAALAAVEGAPCTALGHPNLLRTDLAEVFATLAAAEVPWREPWRPALERLQRLQIEGGRWERRNPLAGTLAALRPPGPSRWITLAAIRGLLAYAVEAELPRLFPTPPSG